MAADGQGPDARCFHCGEPAPAPRRATLLGEPRVFCCDGCAQAAAWIATAGLGDYYGWREAPGGRVDEVRDYAAWDRDDLQAERCHAVPGGRRLHLAVDGMHCAACAWLIDKALRRQPGVLDVGANAISGRVRLDWDPARTRLSALLADLARLGYRAGLPGSPQRDAQRRRERRDALLRIGVAGLGAMQAMMFSEALYLDSTGSMPDATRDAFRWITALVSAPVAFYAGAPFLRGLWHELRLRRIGMDTLVGSAVLLAWGGSVLETWRGGPQVWFDAAVMFVLFMLVARQLEQGVRRAGESRLDALASAQPALAWREDGGALVQVPSRELREGDIVRVAAGETLPADGRLLDAQAAVDEALLNGESRPRRREAGDTLLAGSLVHEGALRLQVTASGAATAASALQRRIEAARGQRPALLDRAERLSRRVVGATVALALLAGLGWWWIDPARAFPIALAVLVVTCPCALALAVPAALARANAVLARRGTLVLGPQALARLARVDHVVFDKTGTLTHGRPRVVAAEVQGIPVDAARSVAAALEASVRHPLARAFGDVPARTVDAPRAHVGKGVEGRLDGHYWRLGQASFALPGSAALAGDDGRLVLARDGMAVARFTIDDAPRGDAADALAALQAMGLGVDVASGDATGRVQALGWQLGLAPAQLHGRQTPEDKIARVQALQARGRRVLMVGDGLNDAAALAVADVSAAMAEGAALAQREADVVIGGDGLGRLRELLHVARQTRRIIRQNLAWAIGYNAVALPLAALGLVGPGLAALGMALSSLAVTANALRIGRAP